MTGERKFSAIFCDGACAIFDGEIKVSAGKQPQQVRENLARKRILLTGHPLTLAGQCFNGVVTGGYSSSNSMK